jgi:hypothetical protein
MARPLEVLADLQVAVDGEDIAVQANGERIFVKLPSLEAGRRVLKAVPFASRSQARSTRQAQEALTEVGLTVEVELEGETLAVFGTDARPGRLGRILPTGGVELRPARTLRRVARTRPFLAAAVVGGLVVLVGWLVAQLFRS